MRDNFGFMHLLPFDEEAYKKLRETIPKSSRKNLPFRIQASDIDRNAVDAARHNAKLAGVDHVIDFQVGDFREFELPESPGVVVMNPEYGARLGDERNLENQYQEIGNYFKQKAAGYWAYVFTGNPKLGKRIGLRTTRKIEFYNGPIDCRLLEYELYAGTKRTSFRDDREAN